MCSLNVCGFNSKLKYHVLQQYMQLFDFICLLETKCNSIDENELSDYKTFIMRLFNFVCSLSCCGVLIHHSTRNTLFRRIVTTRPLRVIPTDSCRKHRTEH